MIFPVTSVNRQNPAKPHPVSWFQCTVRSGSNLANRGDYQVMGLTLKHTTMFPMKSLNIDVVHLRRKHLI